MSELEHAKSAVKYCLLDTPRKVLMKSHIGKDPCKYTKSSVSTAVAHYSDSIDYQKMG